jgi:endonuclease G
MRGIPVWVGWHLQSEDQGSAPRQDDFRGDPALPAGWYQVQDNSYSGSGFDRGHNCPSADRTSTVAANSSTFLMTNIIPQAPKLNQGPWAGLEDYTRTLVGTTKEAYIFMGNHGEGGYNFNNLYATTINNGNVTVPEKVWKVVVLMPKGNNDLSRIDSSATVIVVNMPNDNRLYSIGGSGNNAWRNYITSIAALETEANANGVSLNMLGTIPSGLRNHLKSKVYQ